MYIGLPQSLSFRISYNLRLRVAVARSKVLLEGSWRKTGEIAVWFESEKFEKNENRVFVYDQKLT